MCSRLGSVRSLSEVYDLLQFNIMCSWYHFGFFLRHSSTPELLELVLCEGSNGHLRQALLGVTARVPRKLIWRFCVLGVHDMDGWMFARLAEAVALYFRCTLLGLPFDITMLMFMSSSFCLMATRASTHCSSSSHWVTQSPPC